MLSFLLPQLLTLLETFAHPYGYRTNAKCCVSQCCIDASPKSSDRFAGTTEVVPLVMANQS